MRDLALQAAGVLAMVVAIFHGAIGELRVFRRTRIEPQRARTLLHLIFQATTVDWIGVGVLLIAAPWLGSPAARHWIIAVAVVVYGYAAVANAVASRGRHVGWMLMGCAIALALAGL
jgi:hypothetical protein